MSARVYGLTGQTGAGKTTVAQVLRQNSFAVIDCDGLSRTVTQAGTPCLRELVAQFGTGILNPDATLNRRALGELVFSDAGELARLEKIIYRYIIAELKIRMKEAQAGNTKGIVLDAPTLFESGVDALCDEIIVVIAPLTLRRARIMARDGLSQAAAEKRIAAQKEDAFYTARAAHVLHNSGTQAELVQQAQELAERLQEECRA